MPAPTANVQIIRVDLPTEDAVIVRKADGSLYVVADHRCSDDWVREIAREAPHVRDGRAFG